MDPEPSSYLLLLTVIKGFGPEILIPFIALIILLFCSALISGSEVAFFSLEVKDLEALKLDNKKAHAKVKDLLDSPKTLLATILISNNFINVGIVILSAFITSMAFDFSVLPPLWGWDINWSVTFDIVVITFLLLLFGEVLPKTYATRQPLRLALFMTGWMRMLRAVFKPLSLVLVNSTGFIEKRLGQRANNLSVDDLSQALELTNHEEGEDDEQKILRGIVKFGNTNVKQIMKARMDVVCADIEWGYDKLMETILESGYSRIPVYKENFDQVKGVLYIKDLLPHIEGGKDFKWQELLREAFYVPENKKIDDLLNEFQEKKVHLAIVVDEFGGTSGIITLEDVIEEIVGEISDEFDDEELVYSKLDDLNYVFEGKIHLTDFFKVLGLDEEIFDDARGEADTLAGFLLEIAGKFPEKNEEIDFKGMVFKVEGIEDRRINRIKVTLLEKEKNES